MSTRAFSLVEVVIALAVISFAMIAVIGLLAVALQTNRESSDQLQEANTASLLLSTIRATPTNPPTGFGLPNLNQATASKTVQIGVDGMTTSPNLVYNLYYVAGTNAITGTRLANVYIALWGPLAAAKPVNNPGACYEVTGEVALP